jgi:hypothetical protein
MWQIYRQLVAVQRQIYLTGSTAILPCGLAVSLLLAAVHAGMSVLIALLSLPLISIALGSVAPAEGTEPGPARYFDRHFAHQLFLLAVHRHFAIVASR